MNKQNKVMSISIPFLLLCITFAISVVGCNETKESVRNGLYIHIYSEAEESYSDNFDILPKSSGNKSIYEKMLSNEEKLYLSESVQEWYKFFEYYTDPPKESTIKIDDITYIKEYDFPKDSAVFYYQKMVDKTEEKGGDYRKIYLDFGNAMYFRTCNIIKLNPPAVNKYRYNEDTYYANDEALQEHLFNIAKYVNMISKNYYDD